MSPTELGHLFKFIEDACTNSQIRALLRAKKKDGSKVKLGQTTKDVMENLVAAHNDGVVTDDELMGLLAAGEENGRQHIFFYRVPVRAHSKYSNSAELTARLRTVLSTNGDQLPHFVLMPEERVISDIRSQRLANDQLNVIAKWYSGREFEEVVLKEVFRRNGDQFIRRESKIEKVRLVSMARYHPRGLLEIRVPTGERESRKTCLSELETILELLAPVFSLNDLVLMSLRKAMKTLQETNGSKGAKHRVSAAQVADGDARAEFNPALEGQDLFASIRHKEAIGLYEDLAQLDVYWESPVGKKDEEDEIRCQIGLYQANGIRLGAKRAGEEIDFVINRLWDLSK